MSLKSIFLDCANVANGIKTYMGISHPMEKGNINDVIENRDFLKEILRNEKHWNILDVPTITNKIESTPDRYNPSYDDILLNSIDYAEYPPVSKYINMRRSNFSLLRKIGKCEGNGKQILSDILADKEPIILLDCLTNTNKYNDFDNGLGYLLRGVAERKGLVTDSYVSSYLRSYFDQVIADDEILALLTHPKLYRKAVECLVNLNQTTYTTRYCLYTSGHDTINPLLASGRIPSGHRLMLLGGRAEEGVAANAFQPCRMTGLGVGVLPDPTDASKKIMQFQSSGASAATSAVGSYSYSKVDLTHAKKIIFDLAFDTVSGTPDVLFGVGTSSTAAYGTQWFEAYQELHITGNRSRKTYEVDVSELSGQYHLKFNTYDNKASSAEKVNIQVYEVSLEF